MRHRVAGYKLNRDMEHRRAMWRNLAVSLFAHGQITTTVAKAKSVQPMVEKIITLARQDTLTARRRVIRAIGNPYAITFDVKEVDPADVPEYKINRYGELVSGPRVVKKLFGEIGPKYKDRDGGYTRIVRLAKRRIGDGGDLCVLQLVGDEEGPQISGQYSRRRDKANRRMVYAAELRKARAAEASAAPKAATNDAVVDAPASTDGAAEEKSE